MARYPRVECPVCEEHYAGVPTRRTGMVSVHDHKRTPRALVLCEGSMSQVPVRDAIGWQDELPEPGTGEAPDVLTLF
ncbi:hypothetical protein [Streptomyces sp. NBC_00134]|uniref:hypothetical protein n=1 Tax=Streptomyces sp. NBC_00134 TaxID=2975663 RepID=UPI00324C4134